VAVIFFQPFLGTICIAALMAYLLFPLYNRLTKHFSDNISALIIVVGSSLVVIIPIAIILITATSQAISLANSLASTVKIPNGSNIYQLSGPTVTSINDFLAPFVGKDNFINSESLANFAGKVLPTVINGMANSLMSFLGNIPTLFTNIIVYFFLIMAFLKHSKSAVNFIKAIIPFDDITSEKYFEKSGLIVSASLKGQFVISIVTAVTSTILVCLFFGIWQYFVIFVIGLTLLGMVPLGSGIVVIPLALFEMFTGNFWAAFWVLLIYLAVICNIDTVLRPRLIPKKANLIPAITTLATFSGIYYFGIMGIIYGPLIVILLTTTADIYISSKKQSPKQV
jgi:predicted PurR-regulated permease PerM